jgi:hypothetical protein
MKYLTWIALVIGVVVGISGYRGVTIGGLDWVVIGLAVSVILLAISQIGCCKKQ